MTVLIFNGIVPINLNPLVIFTSMVSNGDKIATLFNEVRFMNYPTSKRRSGDMSYESGLTEGRLTALENDTESIQEDIEKHENRIRFQERIAYGVMGAITLIEFGPTVIGMISK
ncbi:MAG: hypothetical protein KZQ66_11065 [Candidatus Thiodiazotropha sp. (ex Lucinoma aequizonata)]|nr:hypothetical protein [Candidatus Thiodiazotropha sp. (ex Lucinoma aequizonata)]MCU7902464.1 hypothetical protein [Candidatus Thiodiazotropha sp. (ex Lucinoma aequizonata)]